MDRSFSCPHGHRWSRPADETVPTSCPLCGAAPVSSADGGPAPVADSPTTRHALVPGYQLLQQTGMGDMAIVFRARDIKRDRFVAVKVLSGDDQIAPGAIRRFQREGRCLANLAHPNIVTAYEAGVSDGVPFLVMEYLEGGSLTKKLNGAPMPPGEAAALLEVLAKAIHYVHGRGFVHRNLKPHGILFAADGTPKVTDFGLARWLKADSGVPEVEGEVVGTPSYMAPEQAAGRVGAIGPATDVFGLGAILYECLTGRPPFRGPTVMETLQRVLAWEPVPPRSLNRQADREIEGVCLRCLQKKPVDRYASAQEVADDLRRYLDGKPVQARRANFWGRLFRRD